MMNGAVAAHPTFPRWRMTVSAATRRACPGYEMPRVSRGYNARGVLAAGDGSSARLRNRSQGCRACFRCGRLCLTRGSPHRFAKALTLPPGPRSCRSKARCLRLSSLTRKERRGFRPRLRPADRAITMLSHGSWNSHAWPIKSVPAWTTTHSWVHCRSRRPDVAARVEQAVAEHIHATTTTLTAPFCQCYPTKPFSRRNHRCCHTQKTPFTVIDLPTQLSIRSAAFRGPWGISSRGQPIRLRLEQIGNVRGAKIKQASHATYRQVPLGPVRLRGPLTLVWPSEEELDGH